MKGSEKPKKLQKKQAQKALKQRRLEKRVAREEIRLQPTMGRRRSAIEVERSASSWAEHAEEHAMIRPPARSE